MHIHFEKTINAKCDCTILSMSWMGKVPDELPEEEGWKLNRNHYYQEGWLATGNIRGVLGVTYTTSNWKKSQTEVPMRSNYNLRGHRSQITLVQWNEPYQKLASCDSSGIIFVWIKFEGRWSIELINDRSTPVTHFSWSHDGRMALICYQDGFVLVGSVAGQRYWSTMLNLDSTITCGIWTPDDQQVYFGTSTGQLVVMDVVGSMVSQVQLPYNIPIISMAWSCEKFKMEESDETANSFNSNLLDGTNNNNNTQFASSKKPFTFAVCFSNGVVYMMKNYDDVAPTIIHTGLQNLHMEWNNSGEYLAIAGSTTVEYINKLGYCIKEFCNSLHFYNHQGIRILNIKIPSSEFPVTAMTWGHNDKRIFVATGKIVHVGWVSKRVASLQLLCRLTIYKCLRSETCVAHLPLPLPVRALISSLHTQTIMSILPKSKDLREYVTHPPPGNLRLFCTMIRHEEDLIQSSGTVYTLYIEFLGGLVPILKGKRISKIRPEFVIYDPQSSSSYNDSIFEPEIDRNYGILVKYGGQSQTSSQSNGGSSTPRNSIADGNMDKFPASEGTSGLGGSPGIMNFSDSSESEDVELCASPRLQRKRMRNRLRERLERDREWELTNSTAALDSSYPLDSGQLHSLMYNDVLPEAHKLVEVSSNIWGTKFKIHGTAQSLPTNLGQVTYKTSLLHLQPRQMTLHIMELKDDIFLSPEGSFPHEDEEEEDFSVMLLPTNSTSSSQQQTLQPQASSSSVSSSPLTNSVLESSTGPISIGSHVPINPSLSRGPSNSVAKSSEVSTHPKAGSSNDHALKQFQYSTTSTTNETFQGPRDACHSSSNSSSSSSSSITNMSSSSSKSNFCTCTARTDTTTGSYCSSCCALCQGHSTSTSVTSSTSSPFHVDDDEHDFLTLSSQSTPDVANVSGSTRIRRDKDGKLGTSPIKSNCRRQSLGGNDDEEEQHIGSIVISRSGTCTRCRRTSSKKLSSSSCFECRCKSTNSLEVKSLSRTGKGENKVEVESCATLGQIGGTMDRVGNGITGPQNVQLSSHELNSAAKSFETMKIMEGYHPPSSPSLNPHPNSGKNEFRTTRTCWKSNGFETLDPSATEVKGTRNKSRNFTGVSPSSCGIAVPSTSNQAAIGSAVTAPIFVPRSFSVSYLDDTLTTSPSTLDGPLDIALSRGSSTRAGENRSTGLKRLILVKKRKKCEEGGAEQNSSHKSIKISTLLSQGRSKSWDATDFKALRDGTYYTLGSLGAIKNLAKSSTKCPECKFPNVLPASGRQGGEREQGGKDLKSILCTPKTPCRALRRPRSAGTSKAEPIELASPLRGPAQVKAASQSQINSQPKNCSTQDPEVITRLPEEPIIGAAATTLPAAEVTPGNPKKSKLTGKGHKRSLSLLTPLLKRREKSTANNTNYEQGTSGNNIPEDGGGGGNENHTFNLQHRPSSSFIPPGSPQHQPRSSPSTPASQRKKHGYFYNASTPLRQLLANSPLLSRRRNNHANNGSPLSANTNQTNGSNNKFLPASKNQSGRASIVDSSDDEDISLGGNAGSTTSNNFVPISPHHSKRQSIVQQNVVGNCPTGYRDLETFQKNQLRQKLRKKKIHNIEISPVVPRRREFLMHNKAPMWNENSQVYQLDFGGRVTQESAKNFQIEFRGKQVMQFGRIDGNAYTMDFQYPFSAIQAFAVALANVTQRLK